MDSLMQACRHAALPRQGLVQVSTGVADGDDAAFNLEVEAPRV
jgi:hypothetical protein